MSHFFLELASILVLATFLGIAARALKQPLIIAYIFTGVLISLIPSFKGIDHSILEMLSNFGVAFLLFLVGVDMHIEDLKYVGKAALYTGIGQIVFTALVGFILISALGFSTLVSVYIAIAITFSSTVIIIKLLSEKNDLQSLYGKIAVGYLLVQDFVAIVALMILSGFGDGKTPGFIAIFFVLLKGLFLVGITAVIAKYGLKILFRTVSSSVELLFVAAIAWAFLMSAVAESFGFSVAIGAFLAGIAIASSPYRFQISGRIKPLRDFFVIIFFIMLGSQMIAGVSGLNLWHVLILSIFILIGKPLIVVAIMMTLKFRNRTSFMTSVTVAQVSEFSLILMSAAFALGYVSAKDEALVASVGVVTITLSSYLILYGDNIYKFINKPFSKIFPEKSRDPYIVERENLTDHIVLVGGEQMGSDVLSYLDTKVKDKKQIVVVDFNPKIFTSLKNTGYNAVFGDISDPEVLEELELGKAKAIIITDPDIGDSTQLIQLAKAKNFKGPVIGSAYWVHDAIKLYELGADYVVVPETVGGKHIAKVLAEHWENLSKIKKDKSKNFGELVTHKVF